MRATIEGKFWNRTANKFLRSTLVLIALSAALASADECDQVEDIKSDIRNSNLLGFPPQIPPCPGFAADIASDIKSPCSILPLSSPNRDFALYIKNYGGEPVSLPEYHNDMPWMVSISEQDSPSFCGGAYIGNNLVLTAAHCVFSGESGKQSQSTGCSGYQKEHLRVAYGDRDLQGAGILHANVVDLAVFGGCEIVNYGGLPVYNGDFALLKLEEGNHLEQSIAIHPHDSSSSAVGVAKSLGWGYAGLPRIPRNPNKCLNKITVQISDAMECDRSSGDGDRARVLTHSFCVKNSPPRDDSWWESSCSGDSGAPLLTLDTEQPRSAYGLVGVYSFDTACPPTSLYTRGYGRIDKEVACWIEQKMNRWSEPAGRCE